MPERVSFWKRVSGIFGGSGHSAADPHQTESAHQGDRPADSPVSGSTTAAFTEVDEDSVLDAETPAGLASAAAKPMSWRRQSPQTQFREVSQRIVELADAMQQHFGRQDEHATKFASSLERVGGVLEQIAEGQRAQSECLRSIAKQTETANRHASGLAEVTSRIPESLLAQAEAIRGVARQLEFSNESDTQLLTSLKSFSQAVDTLGSAGTAQVDALQRLNSAQSAQHEAFTTLVREQSRRFQIMMIGTAGVAVLAMAALVIVIIMRTTA